MVKSYCDCGHLSIFHLIWKMNDGSEHVKCFGRDRDIYYRTLSKFKLEEDIVSELRDWDVDLPMQKNLSSEI